MTVVYRWFSRRHERFRYLDRVAVHERFRRRGVGTVIYDEAKVVSLQAKHPAPSAAPAAQATS
jgi:predicted GNAT superfamily acetyltransferase